MTWNADLTRVHNRHRATEERALRRLARWMAAHPEATPEDVIRSDAYEAAVEAFDGEIREMHGALVEVLPPLIEAERYAPRQ